MAHSGTLTTNAGDSVGQQGLLLLVGLQNSTDTLEDSFWGVVLTKGNIPLLYKPVIAFFGIFLRELKKICIDTETII